MAATKKRQVARSEEDKARKRELILDAALRLIKEHGYTKTTMSDVAVEAGVGRGTLYWHYDSKDDLVYAMLEREIHKLMQVYAPLEKMQGRAVEKIEMMIRVSFQALDSANELMKPLVSVVASGGEELDMRLWKLWASMYARFNEVIEVLLEQGKAEGDVRGDLDSPVVAAAVVGLLDAMYLQHVFGLVPEDPDRLGESVLSLLESGYRGGER